MGSRFREYWWNRRMVDLYQAVERHLDTNTYPAGQNVSDAQMATIRLQRDAFHGEWNYTIAPHDPVLAKKSIRAMSCGFRVGVVEVAQDRDGAHTPAPHAA